MSCLTVVRWSLYLLVVILVSDVWCVTVDADRIIKPNQHWLDTDGNRIESHGGGFLWDETEQLYFWYGESQKNDNASSHHINCYSAPDLSGPWTFEGVMLDQTSVPPQHKAGPYIIERPKVVFDNSSHTYVLWFHFDTQDYGMRYVGIARASSPRGPFVFWSAFQPDGVPSLDLNLFVDRDNRVYLIRSCDNSYVGISQLSPDLTNTTGLLSTHAVFEGMALFRSEAPASTLFVIGSALTGWQPNAMQLYRSSTGSLQKDPDWQNEGNPTHDSTSFNTQPTFVYPMLDRCGQPYFIYMGDNWIYCGPNPKVSDLINACYVWLPMRLDANDSSVQPLQNVTEWSLDDPFNEYGSGACPSSFSTPDGALASAPLPRARVAYGSSAHDRFPARSSIRSQPRHTQRKPRVHVPSHAVGARTHVPHVH